MPVPRQNTSRRNYAVSSKFERGYCLLTLRGDAMIFAKEQDVDLWDLRNYL